jgi:hypothetical protein
MFGAFEDPVSSFWIRWLSDPSDLNLSLRELPKAHAQKKRHGVPREGKDSSYCSVTAASHALATESLAGLTVQALGVGLLRAAQRNRALARTCRRGLSGGWRRIRGVAKAGTRRLPIDPDARAGRDLG